MSTLSSANVTDVNLVLKERTHVRLCLNMLIFTHNLGNWLIIFVNDVQLCSHSYIVNNVMVFLCVENADQNEYDVRRFSYRVKWKHNWIGHIFKHKGFLVILRNNNGHSYE